MQQQSVSPLADGQVLSLDGRRLTVRVSARRRRLGLTVERDGSLTLRVPGGCGRERAEEFVRDSRGWIEEKLALWERNRPLNPVRRLVDGELFRYLGRDYRLALVDDPGLPVGLVAGELRLDRKTAADPRRGRLAITGWYRRSGLRLARGRLQPWAGRMEVPEPALAVRDLGRRWGTYRSDSGTGTGCGTGRMALHWAVFQLPVPLLDYVIAHELAHIRVPGHGPDYWRLLRRAIPECEALKDELDAMGRHLWLGAVAGTDQGN
ncbi:M48 family metallopeptidase [Streptomyces sp. enrichment culture]|uniref:M48 family metallopeptidase n=1 Tax=Streptomyces sp. enrichment culture TaxID=1795815 RepID=UPI003F54CAF6